MKKYLLIHRIRIQNANAMSSPYTIAFGDDSMVGAVHALQRKYIEKGIMVRMPKTAISLSDFRYTPIVPKGRAGIAFDHRTANPLNKKGDVRPLLKKPGATWTISLLSNVGVDGDNKNSASGFRREILQDENGKRRHIVLYVKSKCYSSMTMTRVRPEAVLRKRCLECFRGA